MMLVVFEFTLCPVCLFLNDSTSHLLFDCPSKEKLKEFVHTESSSSLTLSQIWLAHMRFVFDKIGIVPEVIMVNIRSIVRQTVDEDQIHSLL
ncbi:hypothetical protein HMPREF1544_02956 [Mucor circinelloides 1006PhL]|uniref:Reverse transcriptase zinc-binding domain-containing protein n=1 Tax=Mucor circinelloides f. circinelloides (strain 1006PhL) TaxID=1220926 RepID=S2KD55_MUCC1|nr:hypothetical protein HMPREF1544_02956 [Mucor circinelloides 1006PhL]